MLRLIFAFSLLIFGAGCGSDEGSKGGAGGAGGGAGTGGAGGSGTGGAAGAGGSLGGSGGVASGCTPKTSGWISDLGSFPEGTPPALPSAGASITDPNFGTRVVRLTDDSNGSHCENAYSYWPTFNATSTRLFVSCENGTLLYDLDPATGTASNPRALFANPTPEGTTPGWEDAIWSDVDANLLFAHDGTRLYALDTQTGSYTLVRDFSSDTSDGHVRQMSKSADDDVFGFTTQNASYDSTGALAFRRSSSSILTQLAEAGLDEAQVDKSGAWLVVKTGQSGQGVIEVKIVDLGTGSAEDLTDDGPDFSPGHSDNGMGTVVGADNWNNRVTFRQLATPHQHSTVLDLANDWGQDYHVSMHANDEGWVLLSLYEGGAHTPGLFHDEIIQVKTDGSGEVRRLAHHHSLVADYWDSPRANISRDGCFVAFTSSWGASGRRDVFLLDLSE
jgi:hypothetical protein